MNLLMCKYFHRMLLGYFVWKKIKCEEKNKKTCYWLLSENEKYIRLGIELIEDYLEVRNYESINLIVPEIMKEKLLKFENQNNINRVICVSDIQYNGLVCLYNVLGERLPLELISCNEPQGRNIEKYMNMGNIQLDELFRVGVMGIL